MRRIATACAAIALLALGGLVLSGRDDGAPAGSASAAILVPELTGDVAEGKTLFGEYCAACHGENGAGTDQGPPLIHPIYEPGHHPDAAFFLAARNGVRGHHWQFGNMMPVEGVTDDELAKIVAYVRAVQRANGID